MFKDYMGDGGYIEGTDWGSFITTTENGGSVQNTIEVDSTIFKAITRYITEYFPAKLEEKIHDL